MIRTMLLGALGVALLVGFVVWLIGKLAEDILRSEHGDRVD